MSLGPVPGRGVFLIPEVDCAVETYGAGMAAGDSITEGGEDLRRSATQRFWTRVHASRYSGFYGQRNTKYKRDLGTSCG